MQSKPLSHTLGFRKQVLFFPTLWRKKKTDLMMADSNHNKKQKSAAAGLIIILLPVEITIDILSRLPIDSVIQCKRVCKAWRSLIDHDHTFLASHTRRRSTITSSSSSGAPFCFFLFVSHRFISTTNYQLHFGQYHSDDNVVDDAYNVNVIIRNHVKLSDIPIYPFHQCNAYKRISSCNGLILIASISSRCNNCMMVFNPVTREYVYLPPSGEEVEVEEEDGPRIPLRRITSTGFGYHPFTNEYKVVRIKYPRKDLEPERGRHGYIYVYIYTLGCSGRSWRRKEVILKVDHQYSDSTPLPTDYVFDYSGLHLNGVIYWIGIKSILSFDLADEEFKILPVPPGPWPQPPFSDVYYERLGVLDGCLCLSRSRHDTTDLWIHSSVNSCSSWTKKLSMSAGDGGGVVFPGKYQFVAALESGKILFSSSYRDGSHFHLVSYDPETGSVHDEGESFRGRLNGWANIIPYVKSFVSLKELGEETVKCVLPCMIRWM